MNEGEIMAKRGRPPKYNDEQMSELVAKFREYIENTDIPIVAEFAYQNGLYKQYFYDHDEFTDLVKMATSKKEAALEYGALKGTLNPTMAVFSLKQMGWTDKQQTEMTGSGGAPLQVIFSNKMKKDEEA